MKKVMVRAWEIARTAVKKFGGKVKQYLSMSLTIAWEELKKAMDLNFTIVQQKNMNIYFAVNDIEGMDLYLLSEKLNLKGENVSFRKEICEFSPAKNKQTGQNVRIYYMSQRNNRFEFVLNDEVIGMTFEQGKIIF